MADRVAPGAFQQLHHFISASTWRPEPLELELVRKAQDLVGGADAVLAIDDTALVKQGQRVGRRGAPVLRATWQTGQLSGPGLAHPGPPRGAGLCRAAPVPAGNLGAGYGPSLARRRSAARRVPAEVAHRPGGNRPRPGCRGGVRLCGRRRRIWQGGALPGRSGGARAALRRRHSVDPERSIPPTSRSSPLPAARPVARPSTRCRRSRPALSGRRSPRCRPTPGASCRGAPAPRAGCGRASSPCGCASPTAHGCAPAGVCRARPRGWSVSSGPRTSAGIT